MQNDLFPCSLLDNINDGVYVVDINRKITFWNHGAEKITGYKATEVTGHSCLENILVHIDENGSNLCMGHCPIVETISKGEPHVANVFLHHKQGRRIPVHVYATPLVDDTGQIIGAMEMFSDRTKYLDEYHSVRALKRASLIDILTGLPNRRYMEIKLDEVVKEYNCFGIQVGFFCCGLDRFGEMKNTFGHVAGDDIFRMIADTLDTNMRKTDELGRWSDEEFFGILPFTEKKDLASAVEKLRMLVEKSFIVRKGLLLRATATFGVTSCNKGDTVESIIERADNLFHEGRKSGHNSVIKG